MTRNDLVKLLHEKVGSCSKKNIEKIIKAIFCKISSQLKNGGTVEMRDFGRFSLRKRNEKTITNPRTSAQVKIKSGNAIFFRATKKVTNFINE